MRQWNWRPVQRRPVQRRPVQRRARPGRAVAPPSPSALPGRRRRGALILPAALVLVAALVVGLAMLAGRAPASKRSAGDSPLAAEQPPTLATRPKPLVAQTVPTAFESRAIQIRDLGSERPVGGMRLEVVEADGTRRSTETDEDGRIKPLVPVGARIVSADDAWRLASPAPERIGSVEVLWAWRTIRLVVEVASGEPEQTPNPKALDPKTLAVTCRFGGRAADGGDPGQARWNARWIVERGLPEDTALLRVPGGAFEATVPRVRGYGVRASAPGYECAWQMLEFDAFTEEQRVYLVLRPCKMVRGIVRGFTGEPLANAEVRAYVVRHAPRDEISLGHLRVQFVEGYTASWPKDSDTARVTTFQTIHTGEDGAFALPLRTRGQVWLVAYAAGHEQLERGLGVVDRDVDDLDLTLTYATPALTTVRNEGVLLASTRINIADMSLRDVQATRSLESNERGQIRVDWMRPGRTYLLVQPEGPGSKRHRAGFFVWTGQEELDVSRLEQRWE